MTTVSQNRLYSFRFLAFSLLFCVDSMFCALRSNILTADVLICMAHGVVKIEFEIAVCECWLSVDIPFMLPTLPCGDSV